MLGAFQTVTFSGLSPSVTFSVIPAKAGIRVLFSSMHDWVPTWRLLPIQRFAVAGILLEQSQRFRIG